MKKFYLLPFLVFAFFSCEKEEIISEVEIQEAISTTKIKTALSVLQSTRQDKRSKSQKGTVIAQMELMGYEEIKNSKEKLLVIPAFLEGNSGESRI